MRAAQHLRAMFQQAAYHQASAKPDPTSARPTKMRRLSNNTKNINALTPGVEAAMNMQRLANFGAPRAFIQLLLWIDAHLGPPKEDLDAIEFCAGVGNVVRGLTEHDPPLQGHRLA